MTTLDTLAEVTAPLTVGNYSFAATLKGIG